MNRKTVWLGLGSRVACGVLGHGAWTGERSDVVPPFITHRSTPSASRLAAHGTRYRQEGQTVPETLREWWSLPFLERLHAVRQELAAQRLPVRLDDRLEEYRAVIHCHSLLSHDSRGTLQELVAAAHASDTQVVLMAEHPSADHDVYAQGWRGIHDGVLFIPGAETRNLLVWPRTLRDAWEAPSRQEFVDRIRDDQGLVLITHLDTFDEWGLRGVQGLEIYNIHVDAENDPEIRALLSGAPDFALLLQLARSLRKYPLEAFAALFDEPAEFVQRWDELLVGSRMTGIAGNDAHQNTGFIVRAAGATKLEVWSVLDERLAVLNLDQVPFLRQAARKARPGAELMRLQLDPYPVSFQLVGTHLLTRTLSEAAIREALAAGHAFVGFDWIADTRGFTAIVRRGRQRWVMGDEIPFQPGLRLHAEAPLPVRWRLLRQGERVSAGAGRQFEAALDQPGVYRIEARLVALGHEWPWIYANPFYLVAKG